ncbi:cobyric acid synthase [Tepidibacter formicigenes]|jgi:adenosylcobyric acid synthase|uniref:Cobyric acid synthase n=1 Tax=Tepidibacter formicigenes DSM 15518 TaxID=1123349 RepID=A0A1M6TDU0_9FIRM|nr:cobyric acid synthase [Tepidibacter formicigenes]SHK55034.1 adenosylcobyric acid synthase (glutamine-hydrolysing) [Tepidibacter formicigenes DSM 15518]
MGKSVMLQGTASGVGKSLITAAFCRIFKQDGYKVAPFKSQNMALNSFITKEGLEMGRAQVFQAEAAGLEPDVRMNPILLKPTTDKKAQVILNGKVHENMDAQEYHKFKPQLESMIKDIYENLSNEYDIVVLEGAGSPAEINLRENDVVNMGMAKISDSPVIIIGDIDRGGVFASLAGTMMLLTEEERKRVKGVIINKFRGDIKILEPGIKMIEDIIKVPVLGVIPYSNLKIEDEDSLADRFRRKSSKEKGEVNVEVLYLPHVSNFTDFNVFETQEDVNLRYVMRGESIGDPDILIIPGSKNTIEDLIYLRESGLERKINDLHKRGKLIFGICGGYQMLGKKLYDPEGIECGIKEINGIGLLDIETTFEGEKITTQVEAVIQNNVRGYLAGLEGVKVEGYEIHMGRSTVGRNSRYLDKIIKRVEENTSELEGAINIEGNVVGSYIHGIFDNINFTRSLLNNIRKMRGLDEIESSVKSFKEFKEREYDKLANIVRSSLDMNKIYEILEGEE